jgi:NAD(P)-dependent dehydrogenase (short-subunit alcohol dehydrogenase family)
MRNSQDDRWTEADVPAQRGRTAVITGANTGLGFETARVLATRGAQVVLAYYQSKLANLMFTYELQRRLAAAQARTQALAAHPGKARTEFTRYLPGWMRVEDLIVEQPFGQSAAMGALATLRAAADPAARGGEYYGPGGRGELRGYPRLVGSSDRARDAAAQQRLWRESERLTGVSYPV